MQKYSKVVSSIEDNNPPRLVVAQPIARSEIGA